MSPSAQIRRLFLRDLAKMVAVVWPVLSGLIVAIAGLGMLVAWLEGWRLLEGVYFSFVTGLTVGYGDLVPKRPIARVLAILIGFSGILLTALLAAIGVRALQTAAKHQKQQHPSHPSEPASSA